MNINKNNDIPTVINKFESQIDDAKRGYQVTYINKKDDKKPNTDTNNKQEE